MLDLDGSPGLEFEKCLDMPGNSFGNIDPPGSPFASIVAAVFTASPQMSKVNFRRPTTPDITGPV